MRDYYRILGVEQYATLDEIKVRYKEVIQQNQHPGDFHATEMVKQFHEAYRVLADPEKRAIYDEQRQENGEGADRYQSIVAQPAESSPKAVPSSAIPETGPSYGAANWNMRIALLVLVLMLGPAAYYVFSGINPLFNAKKALKTTQFQLVPNPGDLPKPAIAVFNSLATDPSLLPVGAVMPRDELDRPVAAKRFVFGGVAPHYTLIAFEQGGPILEYKALLISTKDGQIKPVWGGSSDYFRSFEHFKNLVYEDRISRLPLRRGSW